MLEGRPHAHNGECNGYPKQLPESFYESRLHRCASRGMLQPCVLLHRCRTSAPLQGAVDCCALFLSCLAMHCRVPPGRDLQPLPSYQAIPVPHKRCLAGCRLPRDSGTLGLRLAPVDCRPRASLMTQLQRHPQPLSFIPQCTTRTGIATNAKSIAGVDLLAANSLATLCRELDTGMINLRPAFCWH